MRTAGGSHNLSVSCADCIPTPFVPSGHGETSSKCNSRKNVFWSFPAEAFSRARVDKIDNRIQGLLRNSTEITAFGEEKSQQAVCILICTALPRLVRLGKVDQRVKLLFDLPELRKFTAIIQRDAPTLTSFSSFTIAFLVGSAAFESILAANR